jgi:hypothetical protein
MMAQDNRPVQDIAGVAGGGLESDRDPIPAVEPDPRSTADDRGVPKRVEQLNDKDIAPKGDRTRTITGSD